MYLHIPEEKATLLAPQSCWCCPEALPLLEKRFGRENVKLVNNE